ncbi:MAG: hypothetical protein IPH12_11580 [Saprospirales bacterium]|nr:hypothetical protein [Saprospirales bacterium]
MKKLIGGASHFFFSWWAWSYWKAAGCLNPNATARIFKTWWAMRASDITVVLDDLYH